MDSVTVVEDFRTIRRQYKNTVRQGRGEHLWHASGGLNR